MARGQWTIILIAILCSFLCLADNCAQDLFIAGQHQFHFEQLLWYGIHVDEGWNPAEQAWQLSVFQDLYQKSAQLTNLKTLITLLEVSWERTQEQERLVDYALSANAETHFMGIHCIPIEYSDKINNITLFIKTVATNLKPSHGSTERHAVVVGAGPVGLLNSLVLHSLGVKVDVFEKRQNYTRDNWFDLGPSFWYTSNEWLNKFGIAYQRVERVYNSFGDDYVYTMRCQVFERFVAKVALISGVNLHYANEVLQVCETSTWIDEISRSVSLSWSTAKLIERSRIKSLPGDAVINWCDRNHVVEMLGEHAASHVDVTPFDILIGADGARSLVRSQLGIDFPAQTSFKMANKFPQSYPEVNQHPYEIGFLVPGVTTVYKRFWAGHCHVQILFTEEAGSRIWKTYHDFKAQSLSTSRSMGKNAYPWLRQKRKFDPNLDRQLPWEMLFNVVSVMFENPPAWIDDLMLMVLRNPDTGGYSAELFLAEIHRSSSVVKQLESKTSIAVIVGDAHVTAHYRLGVGLNHGFLALEQTQRLAKQYLISRSRDEENQQKVIETLATNENKYAVLRQDRMVQLQVSTMYYEAYCGLLVSFDETEPDLLKAQVVSERIRSQYPNGEYLSPLRPVAIVTECGE